MWCIILLIYSSIQFGNVLLNIFIHVHEKHWSVVIFSYNVFVFGIRVTGLMKWLGTLRKGWKNLTLQTQEFPIVQKCGVSIHNVENFLKTKPNRISRLPDGWCHIIMPFIKVHFWRFYYLSLPYCLNLLPIVFQSVKY